MQEIEYLFFAGVLPSPFRMLGITTYHAPVAGSVYHRHNFVQTIAVERGELSFHYGKQKISRCRPGELLIVPAGVEHLWDVTSAPCRAIQIGHDPFGTEPFGELAFLSGCDGKTEIPVLPVGPAWPELFRTVETEINSPRAFSGILLGAELLKLLAHAARSAPGAEVGGREERLVRQALDRIGRDPRRNVSIPELARTAGLSPSRFAHLFSRHVGMPPRHYLIEKRIELARSLLAFSTLNVSEAAAEAGFGSIYYFSRIFKKYTGVSPQQFLFEQQNHAKERKKS